MAHRAGKWQCLAIEITLTLSALFLGSKQSLQFEIKKKMLGFLDKLKVFLK